MIFTEAGEVQRNVEEERRRAGEATPPAVEQGGGKSTVACLAAQLDARDGLADVLSRRVRLCADWDSDFVLLGQYVRVVSGLHQL